MLNEACRRPFAIGKAVNCLVQLTINSTECICKTVGGNDYRFGIVPSINWKPTDSPDLARGLQVHKTAIKLLFSYDQN